MNEENIKHILVIRFRRVGDAVLSTVLCSSLRRSFPNARIDYVVNAGIDSLFCDHPDIDRLITFTSQENKSVFRYLIKVWRIMRATPYDIILDTRSTARTLAFSLFSLKSKFRIGVAKKYNLGIQNYSVKVRSLKNVDIVEWLLYLLSPLKLNFRLQETRQFRLYPKSSMIQHMRHLMLSAGVDFTKPVIFVAATTRIQHKMWSATKMASVLQRLVDTFDCQLIFNVTGLEEKLLESVKSETLRNVNWFEQIPAASLGELSALIQNCHMFFGNEGGPRHIAQALGVPSIAIFPPNTSATKWLPDPDENHQAIEVNPQLQDIGYEEVSDWLSVEQVWHSVSRFIIAHKFNL